MSNIYQLNQHMLIVADYKDPVPHKHLAIHVIVSPGKEMEWQIDGKHVKCRGICIGPDVLHTGTTYDEEVLAWMFTPVSNFAYSIEKNLLRGKSYMTIEDAMVDQIVAAYRNNV